MTQSQLVDTLRGIIEGRRFVAATYTNAQGERSRITVQYGVSVSALYQRDIAVLVNVIIPELEAAGDVEGLEAARIVLASRNKSLSEGIGQRADYTNRDTFTNVCAGIKVHNVTGDVYLTGLVIHKTVEVPGVYKATNKSAARIAREAVERQLPSAKYRQYTLKGITRITGNGETLTFDAAN